MISFRKSHLITVLLSYGETELANKAANLSDDEIIAIGKLSAKYIAKINLIDQMIATAAVEFMEKKPRQLKRKKRDLSFYDKDLSAKDDVDIPLSKWIEASRKK